MNTRPLLLGHRGVRGIRCGVRENTIAAFDIALQRGCDGIEFDVRLTVDGHAVICHNSKSAGVVIAKTAGEKIAGLPLLDDILARYANRVFLDIELKVTDIEGCLLSALAKQPPKKGYVVSSFLPEALIDLRARNESIPLGLICETRRELQRWPEVPIQYVMVKQSLVTPKLLSDIHSAGKQAFIWTVNKREAMLRLTKWGVDGIISDKAELMVETLRTSTTSQQFAAEDSSS